MENKEQAKFQVWVDKMKNDKKYIRKTRIIILIILLSTALLHLPVKASGEVPQITSGMYFQLGKYNDQPIVWRSVAAEDENGILMVSDKILCYKIFDPADVDGLITSEGDSTHGTSVWVDSAMRVWLNSQAESGQVEWLNGHVPSKNRVFKRPLFEKGDYPYAEEKGFLNHDNFTPSEKSVIKTVSHWQALSEENVSLSENGLKKPFYPKILEAENTHLERIVYRYKIEDMDRAYYGAMYRVNDTVMTLDEKQLCNILNQLGTVAAEDAEGVVPSYEDNSGIYWLRTPYTLYSVTTATNKGGYGLEFPNSNELGVRPAFYLNENNMVIQSGSGTAEDPYVLDGKGQDGIAVFCNSRQVAFDQQPIEENDRVLVPVRAIFEQLGAEVNYDDGDGVITANNGERTVVMQLDNPEMGNGTEVFTLDVPPKLVGDRTLVPLRAVSEAFDCKVEWIESLNRAVIDPPQPEDSDEGHWQSDWDIYINGKGKK